MENQEKQKTLLLQSRKTNPNVAIPREPKTLNIPFAK